MHTTKTKSRCWLLSFAEAPGSGDRWQMDRLENPKRFVMTLRWPSFEEVSIYFRRENIFVGSVHNKENILKLEWRVLVGESVAQQQNMKYIYIWTFVVYDIFHHVLYIFGGENCYHTLGNVGSPSGRWELDFRFVSVFHWVHPEPSSFDVRWARIFMV